MSLHTLNYGLFNFNIYGFRVITLNAHIFRQRLPVCVCVCVWRWVCVCLCVCDHAHSFLTNFFAIKVFTLKSRCPSKSTSISPTAVVVFFIYSPVQNVCLRRFFYRHISYSSRISPTRVHFVPTPHSHVRSSIIFRMWFAQWVFTTFRINIILRTYIWDPGVGNSGGRARFACVFPLLPVARALNLAWIIVVVEDLWRNSSTNGTPGSAPSPFGVAGWRRRRQS